MSSSRIRIEKMTPEGWGLGRVNGKVVFVPHTAPGDEAEIRIERGRKDFSFGRLIHLTQSGPQRRKPECPHHFDISRMANGPACGGCSWQHINEETQKECKREIIRDCLFRIAKLRSPKVDAPLSSPSYWRYRNKVLIPFGRSADGDVVAGFYATGSHDIVPFKDCPVQSELSVRLTHAVREMAQARKWPTYDRSRNTGWLRHLYVRTNQDGEALVTLVTRNEGFRDKDIFIKSVRTRFPKVLGIFQNVQPKDTTVVLGPRWKKLWGRERITERLGNLRLSVSPASFLQINTPACEVLYGVITDLLSQGGFRPSLALDLYSGVGSIALWISRNAERVLGVESVRAAVEDAEKNAELNGVRNARFHAGNVERHSSVIAKALDGVGKGRAAAVLDPPRAGCEKTVLKTLLHPSVGRIVYVSCNPATFARDADWLTRHRWRLTRVRPVDLFPHTSHIETVGLFEPGFKTI